MPRGNGSSIMVGRKTMNKGAWTPEEDERLSQYIELHGSNRWKTVALKAGLDRCGKSCRLRWLNYLRPNIVRGNISDAEEDLILRLHKLLGNRWSLIAGRLPGRTDNEIKNYWNSHLSKKMNYHKGKKLKNSTQTSPLEDKTTSSPNLQQTSKSNTFSQVETSENLINNETNTSLDFDDLFDSLSMEETYKEDWVSKFLEVDGDSWLAEPLCF